jgi:hypothetical protein
MRTSARSASSGKKNALVVCRHDGFTTHYCGVGTGARKFFEAIRILSVSEPLKDYEIHFIAPRVARESPFFDGAFSNAVRKFARSTGGDLHEVSVLPAGQYADINSNWGVAQWRVGSRKAAAIIDSLTNEKVLFLAHDIFFGLVPAYVAPRPNVAGCFIPHSTGKLFGEAYRFPVEKEIFRAVREGGDVVGSINEFMRRHLERVYRVPKAEIVPLHNALLERAESGPALPRGQYGISQTSRIIFSFGRCGSQKQFDVIIKAFRASRAFRGGYQLVLLAPTDITGDAYSAVVARAIGDAPPEKILWIRKFMSPIPILKLRSLDTVVLGSRFECAPWTPLETLRYAKTAKIVYSEIEPFFEVLGDIRGSIRVGGYSVAAWAAALDRAVTMKTPAPRHAKLEAYEKNILSIIRLLAKRARGYPH